MKLDEILTKAGKHKRRKRIGRGDGSGQGCTAGRGHKGYHSRAGSGKNLGMEGGQNPQIARLPKRGFNNANWTTRYQVVNVETLDQTFDDGAEVNRETLAAAKLIDADGGPVKVLAKGELSKKLTVSVDKLSPAAVEKITQAGGSAESIAVEPAPVVKGKGKKKQPQAEAQPKQADADAEGGKKEDASE